MNVIWSEERPNDSLQPWNSLRGNFSSCASMPPLAGQQKLDNTLIRIFTVRNDVLAAGSDEIKPRFGVS